MRENWNFRLLPHLKGHGLPLMLPQNVKGRFTIMKKIFAILLPVALAAGCAHHNKDMGSPDTGTASTSGSSSSQSASSSQLSASDSRFVKEAGMGGLAEVKMGYMGVQNGTSSQVKNLGQKLVTDHTAANKELEQIAARKGVTLPTEVDAKHQKDLDALAKLNGAEFDKAYLHHAVMDHQKDIKKFQAEADKGTDQDLKAFAQKQLPILQQHLDMAKSGSDATHGTTSSTDSSTSGSSTSSGSTGNSSTSGNTGSGSSQSQ
jgi:putative membrane protein